MTIGDKTREAKSELVEGLTIFKVKLSTVKKKIITGDESIEDSLQALLLAQELTDTVDDLLDAIYKFDDRMRDIIKK